MDPMGRSFLNVSVKPCANQCQVIWSSLGGSTQTEDQKYYQTQSLSTLPKHGLCLGTDAHIPHCQIFNLYFFT